MVWAYGSYVGGRVLVLIATAILARLLTPDDFGVVAMAIVAIALFEMFKDLGVTQALVLVPPEEEEEAAHTAWTINVTLGVLLAAGAAGVAPLAANLFDEPDLTALLAVLGLNLPIRAFGWAHYALAQKRLDFRSRTMAELADAVVRGGVGIGLALAGAGAWSLVLGYLAGTLASTITLWLRIGFRPRPRIRREQARRLIGFGGLVTIVDITAAISFNIDNLFVGATLGTTALGLYSIAWRLPQLLIQNVAVVTSQVLFPAYAAVSRETLGHAYLVALRATMIVVVPLAVLLSTLTEPILLVVFGDQWTPAADAMRILCVFATAMTVSIPSGMAYKSTGRPGVLVALGIPWLTTVVVLLVLFADEGIVAVAACQAGAALAYVLVGSALAGRLLGTGARAIGRAMGPAVLAGLVMAAVTVAAEAVLRPALAVVILGTAAGLLAYGLVLWATAREVVTDLVAKVRPPRTAPADAGPTPPR